MFQILNVVARSFGCLPSDLLKLTWKELLVNIQCVQVRSETLHKMLRTQNRKKAMLFPTVPITDLIDIL